MLPSKAKQYLMYHIWLAIPVFLEVMSPKYCKLRYMYHIEQLASKQTCYTSIQSAI